MIATAVTATSAAAPHSMRIPTAEALAALGASVHERDALPATLLVQTDTRALERGAAFLALRGERFDGHRYVEEAFARGASCAIVDEAAALPAGRPGLVVADTLHAYLALGAIARTHVRGPVAGITGSTGKTTSKQFLLALLRGAGVEATATPENENNEVGVAKFLCGLDDGDTRVAIVEMGARNYRDLDPLVAAARPDIGLLTNVGEAHLEIMGSRERIAETKSALPLGARRAVLSLPDAASRAIRPRLSETPMWFGIDNERPPAGEPAVIIEHELSRRACATIIAPNGTERHPIDIRFPGDHNRRNLAGAFAAALLCGADASRLAPVVASLALPHGRYEVVDVPGGIRLVFDAYNASLSGTLATLGTFAREPAARRIAVLGSMAELGDDAPDMHERIGELAARLDVVLAGGRYADATARGVEAAGGTVVRYDRNEEAASWLREYLRSGDAVLLKGSRMYKMEEIAEALGAEVFA
ncbi:MAG: UDP-N-acetylmuramoyl-tripeptide--D-alanyl-D-alanine ligase [Candidatus Eremiobacteraeota bacterium]|nr:UDP-N-acetylmuramoyl-tripeptide--D-alanyl-D-alanine ligase [Candidatus Eremiobacteraeota bacterium]